MLYPFVIAAVAAILAGAGSAIVGYDLWRRRRVESLGEYLLNYGTGALYILTGVAILWLYTALFGTPVPE